MKSPFFAAIALCGLFQSTYAVTGDTQCQKAMCVTAINHNNATTSYDLTVTDPEVGWMSIGFGRSMIIAPLVILWKDSTTGETIVSQRKASDFVMPTVDPNPPALATALSYRAVSNSSGQTLSFSIPSTTAAHQNLIWAWCKTPPSGNTPDAIIVQHDDDGTLLMNMANPLPDSIDGPTTAGSSPAPTATATPVASYGNDEAIPLTSNLKVFVAHGVLSTVAFMVILPIGALEARLLRTLVPGKWWFGAHWVLQWPVSTVLIVVGVSLGIIGSKKNESERGDHHSAHKVWGFILVCMYIAQCCLGGIIHFIKSSKRTKRPLQNYFHAILGIITIGLSFWQVYTGLNEEWYNVGGPTVPVAIETWWKIWVVLIISLYLIGLALLPRQYRLEADQQQNRQLPIRMSVPRRQSQSEYRD